jgi:UDP-apiose/xylose synthase
VSENPTKETTTLCILGCGGFIGSHLLDRLLPLPGVKVIGIDTASQKIRKHLHHPSLTFFKMDIQDKARVRECIQQCDTVISLAALCTPSLYNTVPLRVIEHNYSIPQEVVAMCSAMKKRLVQFSTCEVYGRTIESHSKNVAENKVAPFVEDQTPLVMGPIGAQRWTYACAKQLLERAIFAHHFEFGLDYTIIRPFNFIGPRMDFIPGIDGEGIPRVAACFMEALLRGRPLKLVDGGVSRRCFTYIGDAIDAVMAIIDNPDKAGGHIFNIGNPSNETTIQALAVRMKEIYETLARPQKTAEIVSTTAEEFYGKGYEDCDRRIPDITKAEELLGFRPKIGLEEALTKTIAGFIEEYSSVNG